MSISGQDNLPNGAELVVETLLREGTDIVFGLPGIQLDPLFGAFFDGRDRLKLIDTRHEQGAAYMALGFAEASGKPGVFTVVPGPGLLNAGAALSTAYACGSPVIAMIGQIASSHIGMRLGDLHELPDQSGILERLSRSHELVTSPAQVPDALNRAFDQVAKPGRGPAALELPPDVLAGRTERLPAAARNATPAPLPMDALEQLAGMIASARNPMIFAGRGALHAAESLARIAKRLNVPVVTQGRAKGMLPDSDPLALNLLAASSLWRDCDLVIAIGTRMKRPLQTWPLPASTRLVAIDIDATSAPAVKMADLFIEADALAALQVLEPMLEGHDAKASSGIATAKADADARIEEALAPQLGFLKAIRQALGEEGCIVTDYTQIGYVASIGYPVEAPRRIITSGYQGTLGYAFATALGAKVAMPNKRVAAIVGDGGFLFTATELATAVKHRIRLVTLLFNDGKFGNVRRIQETLYGGKVIATDLVNPEFCAFVQSFGARAVQVASPDDLATAMEDAFGYDLPTVIEIPVGAFPDPWPLLYPALPEIASPD
ncbi:thiamine pyrophosphate-dependent enzyme [Aquamicrobium sp.]|uniref:thiamine pyrophosphate-dependent enzyme n=1 Tax=Aquamicrobium sp. TaxID=1872579 RepID=UPI002586DED5|nr:thiamine pyrophosphate-dependent enzyme [Aquamicrobium sp.]MCK9549224.1 thiamine pyrophosphate-binding protein [Aquamicrobium sp.]